MYFIAFKSSHWRKHWRKHHISFDTVLFAFANCPSGFVALYKHLTWEKREHNELLNSISTREKQRARSREQHAGFAWSMCVKCLAGPVWCCEVTWWGLAVPGGSRCTQRRPGPAWARGWLHGLEGKAWPMSPGAGQLGTQGVVMHAWWAGAVLGRVGWASYKALER